MPLVNAGRGLTSTRTSGVVSKLRGARGEWVAGHSTETQAPSPQKVENLS